MERSSSGGEEPTADSPHAGRVSASPWGPEPVRSCSDLVGGTGSGIESKNGAIIDLTFTFLKNLPDDVVRLNLCRSKIGNNNIGHQVYLILVTLSVRCRENPSHLFFKYGSRCFMYNIP